MNHRIINVSTDKIILLDRLENDDDPSFPWQVNISTYPAEEYRYDEWVNFETPGAAQAFIIDYGGRSVDLFLTRAEEQYERIFGVDNANRSQTLSA